MFWSVNLCRICAQIRETCVPIFEKDTNTGIDIKIRRCLSLNISKDDLKPKQVCQECSIKLNDYYNFVLLHYESNYRFESLLYNTNSAVSMQQGIELDFPLASTEHALKSNTDQYKDQILPLGDLDVEAPDLEQKLLNEIVAKAGNVEIDLQNLVSSPSEIYTDVHTKTDLQPTYLDVSQAIIPNLSNNSGYIKDDKIKNTINTAPNYLYTMQDYEVNMNYDTSESTEVRPIPGKVNIIAIATIQKSNTFVDLTNDCSSSTDVNADDSSKPKKPNANIVCVKSICQAFEKQQPKYEQALMRPRWNKTRRTRDGSKGNCFPCTKCEKSFARRRCLNEHIKKHGNTKPYVCDTCGKGFAVQSDLTSHKHIHTNLFSCQHCGKCFSAPSKLQRHVRTHTGERPFTCAVKDCGRSFSDKCNLMGHQLTHTNVRNFTCDLCKRSYKTKNQLKDHMQAHSDNPIFKCNICNKLYRWRTNLVNHIKKHSVSSKEPPKELK